MTMSAGASRYMFVFAICSLPSGLTSGDVELRKIYRAGVETFVLVSLSVRAKLCSWSPQYVRVSLNRATFVGVGFDF